MIGKQCVTRPFIFIVVALPCFFTAQVILADEEGSDQEVVQRIDELLLEQMQRAGVDPRPKSSDSEFLRRACLDLAGIIPTVAHARDFLADSRPEKRGELVDDLLSSPSMVNHFAEVWRKAMLPATVGDAAGGSPIGFQSWLRDQFSNNMRYDRIVSDLIAATGPGNQGPAHFFSAIGYEPKKLAAASARVFLGLQLACAECHDHPFDSWTQEDFWGYASFFARLPRSGDRPTSTPPVLEDLGQGEVTLPGTEQPVAPRFPGEAVAASMPSAGSRRQNLAIWMASPDNPYVARAAVNRVWAMLFGRGLVEPLDDLGVHNPPSHPELLELLTNHFIDTGFDLQRLLRTLCRTDAYSRTSALDIASPSPPELFAAMAVKVLSPEQLFDSLNRCLTQDGAYQLGRVPVGFRGRRQSFIRRMESFSPSATQYDRGLQQALHLMNGAETGEATSMLQSGLLISLQAPFLTREQRLEILFLATLSRYPAEEELARLGPLLKNRETPERPDAVSTAHADVLWVLLNTAEFTVNR